MTDASRLADVRQKLEEVVRTHTLARATQNVREYGAFTEAKAALDAALVALAEDADRMDWLEASGMVRLCREARCTLTRRAIDLYRAARAAHTATPEPSAICSRCGKGVDEHVTLDQVCPDAEVSAFEPGAATPPAEKGR